MFVVVNPCAFHDQVFKRENVLNVIMIDVYSDLYRIILITNDS